MAMFRLAAAVFLALVGTTVAAYGASDYPIRPVPFAQVRVADPFWSPRQATSLAVTIPYCFKKCEETHRIDNFAVAAGMKQGKFEGIFFNDSDVVKVVEGAAYALSLRDDPQLDAYLDDLIAKIAGAQEPDGYLYTCRTIDPENPPNGAGKTRWSNLQSSHELYNIGHMYEAAVAHHQATGKNTLLDVARKSADLVDRVFGPDGIRNVPGHQEIEIGLCRLYRETGEERYVQLARIFIDERGHENGRKKFGENLQDHLPLIEQAEAVGHAVRAGYFYTGAADVAALTGEQACIPALDRIWNDVVSGKIYITGGTAAQRQGEAFGPAYFLPNKEAYNETCAAIANILWNHRMFLLHGEAKYIDVLERTLYNGFLAGISLEGDTFFYPNPLESDGVYGFNHGAATREPWFGCACCPVNIARFVPSLANYVYGQRNGEVFLNLFVGGEASLDVAGTPVTITQNGRYPWDGEIEIAVEPTEPVEFTFNVRIPGWAQGQPLPSDLYRYQNPDRGGFKLLVNGESQTPELAKGYAPLKRSWRKGDVVHLTLPMPVRRVLAHDKVEADRGRAAVERGPIVYCAEGVDNDGRVRNIVLPDDAALKTEHVARLLDGVTVIKGHGYKRQRNEDGGESLEESEVTLIPYYGWSHRGVGEMQVWLARTADAAEIPPVPTIASTSVPTASHLNAADSLAALNDQQEPKNSNDQTIPRFTWWDHRGALEWVQYELKEPRTVSSIEVYWFDDTGVGQCRVPECWRLVYRDGDAWKRVEDPSEYGLARDTYNKTAFRPVETDALRLTVKLQPDFSGGILEWRVNR